MKIFVRLNGWQRLWVVFSGVTLIVVGVFILYDAGSLFIEDNRVLRGMVNPKCNYVRSLPKDLDSRYANLDQFPELDCMSLYEYLQSTPQPVNAVEFAKQLENRKKEYFLSGAKFYFGMWFFVVLLIYATGSIVAWVRKGFVKSPGGD